MPNNWIWYQLTAADKPAAEAFYRAVVGWKMQPFGGAQDYTVLGADDGNVGGISTASDSGDSPGWRGYIGVEDVDATAARITAAGGTLVHAPADIPDVGRIAAVADPQGVPFLLLRGSVRHAAPPEAFKPNAPGHVGWNELHTTDWARGFDFYAALFGWQRLDAMDMGPMGTYQLFGVGAAPIGGMLNSPNFPRPAWLFYFNVESIDAAQRRVLANGGAVVHGPSEVPGGAWIIQATDPQGVIFALVGPRQ
jgi:predicted enzyme related to lactoylglutathione lyase